MVRAPEADSRSRSASSSVRACESTSCGLPAELLDDILGAAHHDGGNTIGFEMTRHQCRRLVTDRAVRDDHRNVDLVGLTTREDFRRVDVDGDAMAAVGRRAEEAGRQFAAP